MKNILDIWYVGSKKKKKGYSIVFVTFVKKKEKKSEMNEVK